MGVTGLWKLIEQSGKPVPLETLENKVLAVDISIWLHQVVKGFQDNRGATLPNAHLLGLFHRLCKLLFYKIKPVFVFDGGVPELKRETIAKRSRNKVKYHSEADRLQQLLLDSLAKEKVVQEALGPSASAVLLASPAKAAIQPPYNDKDDMFKLPPMKEDELDSSLDQSESFTDLSSNESSFDEKATRNYAINLQDIDVKSSYFQGLPPDIRHEILTDIKETRKQSSWGRLHELPAESNHFSSFQMKRLLKRRQVQVELEGAEKEIGGKSLSLLELEALLSEKGVVDPEIAKQRVVSNEHVRFLHVRDLKKAMASEAKPTVKSQEIAVKKEESVELEDIPVDVIEETTNFTVEEMDLQRAIQLSLQTDANTVEIADAKTADDVRLTKDQRKVLRPTATSLARDYMLEYGGMNDDDIHRLIQPSGIDLSANQTEFKYNDSFIVNGQASVCKTVTATGSGDLAEATPGGSVENEVSTIEIMDDSDEACVSSDIDSDFVDVPDPDDIAGGFNLKSVNPLHMNSPPEADITKDFRLSDLESKKIEVTFKTNQILKVEDDIFADIFDSGENVDAGQSANTIANTKLDAAFKKDDKHNPNDKKKADMANIMKDLDDEMNEVTKLDLESILSVENKHESEDDIGAIEKIYAREVVHDGFNSYAGKLSIEQKSGTMASSSETDMANIADLHTNEKSSPDVISNLAAVMRTPTKSLPLTPSQSQIISDEQTPPPKVPQPFFVKRTPSSKKKTNTETNVESDLQSNVVKNLFECEPTDPILDEQQAITAAANLLKASKSKNELEDIASKLRTDRTEMELERNKRDRLGVSITERMTNECMDLLKLFGIPYIVAPMEAEAQCAFLNQIELTDGTITDDSDIWLFGGQTVYKNFFDQNKYVQEFKAANIERLFHVDRHKMIQMSILVGSDYTSGIHGIGTVTALEVLATFSTTQEKDGETNIVMSLLSSLRKFRDWWQNKTVTPRTQALRKKLKNITFTENFPSSRVVQAYLYPQVDQSKEQFTWGYPDEHGIREFTKCSFGWTRKKTDDILLPVMKKLADKISQQSIRNYFKIQSISSHKDLVLSKRVKKALDKISNPIDESILVDGDENSVSSTVKKAVAKKRTKKLPPIGVNLKNDDVKVAPKAPKTRRKNLKATTTSTDDNAPVVTSSYFDQPSTSKEVRIPDANPPIPQREKDKAIMEKNKLLAIKLLRNQLKKNQR